jgi:hypothetical protein
VGDLTTLEQQAIDFAKRGDFGADALRVNEEITRLAPANHGAWTRLARCCLEMRQLDEASAALARALQLNPQNTIARNLQAEVTKRRAGPVAVAPPRARVKRTPPVRSTAHPARTPAAGFGRAEFAALGHLAPPAAVEALGGGVEALLVALNDRPFAEKVVEARNRAGHAGNWLFRRNTVLPGSPGHIYALHHGGRWEPQMNVGFFAAPAWPRHAVRAGIGFSFAHDGDDDGSVAGEERVVAYFETFQRLVATRWRQLLTGWMASNAGFIQLGAEPAAGDLLPNAAVERLLAIRHPQDVGWVFCGRWLFFDRPTDADTLMEGALLVRWMEQAFADLLPLWMDIYRGP